MGKKRRDERRKKSCFIPEGDLACVTQRKILTQPSALMTSSLPKPNVGTHSGRVVMREGGGGGFVVLVEKKNPWRTYATMETHLPFLRKLAQP